MDTTNDTIKPVSYLINFPTAYMVTVFSIHFAESLAIIVANVLTIVAILKTKKLRRLSTNVYTISLAIADGCIGLLMPVTDVAKLSTEDKQWRVSVCLVRAPFYAFFFISLSTLMAIAVDRYFAVVHPLYYRNNFNTLNTRLITGTIWISELIIVIIGSCYYGIRAPIEDLLSGNAPDLFPTAVFLCLVIIFIFNPIFISIVLYSRIFVRLRKGNFIGRDLSRQKAEAGHDGNQPRMTRNVVRMMSLVVAYLIVTCTPYYIIAPVYKLEEYSDPDWRFYVYEASVILFYSHAFINPVIYSTQSRDFREAYKRLFTRTTTVSTLSATDERTRNSSICQNQTQS